MHSTAPLAPIEERAALIRVRGLVQGVGFRPTLWRLARRHGLRGWVANDGQGVHMHVCGAAAALEQFVLDLPGESPPLARIDRIEREVADALPPGSSFQIVPNDNTPARTGVVPDAATCVDCTAEIFDPLARRFRYAFANCTHCGPRLSIISQIPYDRHGTTMARFALCSDCQAEYDDPADRRFHAQPIACHLCGPKLTLARTDGGPIALASLWMDEADAACTLLQRGHILAIQGLGGFQLACDATVADAVLRLRAGKRRECKPFALMARDLDVIARYACVDETEAALLRSPAAPIVLLQRAGSTPMPPIAAAVAPAVQLLGFMLPNTPLHHLLLQRMQRPIVLTSGNLSDEPQSIKRRDARTRLGGIAEYFLEHNRPIARRVDDSVVRVVAGRARLLRRARGYAPATLPLPPGFEQAPRVLAFGGEFKNTFGMLRDGQAILSPHIGDLQDALTRADYGRAIDELRGFFQFEPQALACDLHPDYAATQLARAQAQHDALPLLATQHHHAHIAACLAENAVPRTAAPVIGVALDGTGYGEDGTLWGGEFLLADYVGYRRIGCFKPVALPGGEAAIREPWRSCYAHLMAQMDWAHFAMNYHELELYRFLERVPRALLDRMLARSVNSPLASSCGRLFDAVAAAVGLAREHAWYEGQGAAELEAAIDQRALTGGDERLSYPFAIATWAGIPTIEPRALWSALLGDLLGKVPLGLIAARFHRGLADVIVQMVEQLARSLELEPGPRPLVALSGGVFQNRVLFELVLAGLTARGHAVLSHSQVPCNDGGLALGQAAIAAARLMCDA
jgi:hydrogenase maturation protein HypF